MKWLKRIAWLAVAALLLAAAVVGRAYWRVAGRTLLEFRICQNTDMILFSDFGEPPQFAAWLEDPDTGRLRTVFVTRRSATGDWEGKAECAAALPRWFEIFKKETGRPGLPRPDAPAPDAVTMPTPKAEHFGWSVEVEPGRRWVCWIEVNLAADYNETFRQHDEETGLEDTDQMGQPSLLYRGEITAEVGERVSPTEHGVAGADGTAEVRRSVAALTTAKAIFKSIEVEVVRPDIVLWRRRRGAKQGDSAAAPVDHHP